MADSLQEQLRKAGLVSDKQLAKAKRVKHAAQMERKAHGGRDETAADAQRARADKASRDRRLNDERDRRAKDKAVAAEIRQLIEANRQSRADAEIAYHFVDGRAVKQLWVTKPQQEALAAGRLAIVRKGKGFELVTPEVAQKIRARNPSVVIERTEAQHLGSSPDDPYAQYPIPDDLDW